MIHSFNSLPGKEIRSNKPSICHLSSVNLGRLLRNLLVVLLFLQFGNLVKAQKEESNKDYTPLIYIEADPLAYINKGYSVHLGYENWGMRFDLTRVMVDFPISFEEAFYETRSFDLITNITGFKIDYIGNRTNWTKHAFVGLDINYQKLDFTHRVTKESMDLSSWNLGVRAGVKIPIYKGFYITPWAAVWRNVNEVQEFVVGEEAIETNKWDWITTFHVGYALPLR